MIPDPGHQPITLLIPTADSRDQAHLIFKAQRGLRTPALGTPQQEATTPTEPTDQKIAQFGLVVARQADQLTES